MLLQSDTASLQISEAVMKGKREKEMERLITEQVTEAFKVWLVRAEKCSATVQKYLRDLKKLERFAEGASVDREMVLAFKKELWDCGRYKISSINSFLVAANRFFKFMGWHENVIETYPVQEEIFRADDKALSGEECRKMLDVAEKEGKLRLGMIVRTLYGTGVRISELKYITVESVVQGEAVIYNKGKVRTVLIPDGVRTKLQEYIKTEGIETGTVFLSSRGNPVDRSNVSKQLKVLAEKAGVDSRKVYPHNFRHMFAQNFYKVCLDIVKVAALLGHSSTKTTLNYLKTTKRECRDMLNKMEIDVGVVIF